MERNQYKIGEFSKLAKMTVKTLRYYDEVGLLTPNYIDPFTGYRYYQTDQLTQAQKISELRQLGISIEDIRRIYNGEDLAQILSERRSIVMRELEAAKRTCTRIDNLLVQLRELKEMKYQAVVKTLSSEIVYYRHGVVADFSKISEFVLETGRMCMRANPKLKCTEPGYCYISYLDGEYRDQNISIEYAEAVTSVGNESEEIHFKKLEETKAICIIHVGPWQKLGDAYAFALKYVEESGYKLNGLPRECYIDGPWNKENPEEYLTELQFPIKL